MQGGSSDTHDLITDGKTETIEAQQAPLCLQLMLIILNTFVRNQAQGNSHTKGLLRAMLEPSMYTKENTGELYSPHPAIYGLLGSHTSTCILLSDVASARGRERVHKYKWTGTSLSAV